MNFPSTDPVDESNHEFELMFEEANETESESRAKPAKEVLVIIPRGVRFKVDVDSIPGATCVKIPVGEQP